VAAHDCRRTFAKLALKGGAPLEQIQLSLGHQSIQTTQRYLGVELDLRDAPCDHLGFRMPSGCRHWERVVEIFAAAWDPVNDRKSWLRGQVVVRQCSWRRTPPCARDMGSG
jgi:hypothetical protein